MLKTNLGLISIFLYIILKQAQFVSFSYHYMYLLL